MQKDIADALSVIEAHLVYQAGTIDRLRARVAELEAMEQRARGMADLAEVVDWRFAARYILGEA